MRSCAWPIRLCVFGVRHDTMKVAKNLLMELYYVSEIPVDGGAQFCMCRRQRRENGDVKLAHQY